ncbi:MULTISPECIES: TonB-dependent receptor [Bacteroides]|jgi:TonB-linked SusC/RagA family outer membrane protein|uniref:SusC/RagA family TonB-linked outer membrane protein n=1 Tax=Bacteroides TaxID=816 RepID=UPI000E4BDB68|nr:MULTISPECIES: TonB-dependent receptor [Bacteroides]RHL12952.1 TonB-dependent receptor [Bacteroides sp. AF39-11AC]
MKHFLFASFWVALICCLIPFNGLAQTGVIKGLVTDETGEPLIGVNIVEIGTTNGTITDVNGTFKLSAHPNGRLKITYVGYKSKEIHIAAKTNLVIKLESDTELLDEVVVVGYGVQKKETLTGSVAQIKSDDILTTKAPSLVSSIQGKIPGIQIRQQTGEPGSFNSMVSIRGFGSPLVVIDGVARDGISDFERLSPDDIESISVLKDASAAIYGMNADNGVIIVTTKKGSQGKTKFSYNGYFGIKSPTSMRQSVDAYTYRLMKNEMDRNNGNNPSYNDEELAKWKAGTEPGYQDHDWLDLTLKNITTQQQHSISATGGSDKVKYYMSLGYMEDNGLLKSNIQTYRKYNARVNMTAELTKNLIADFTFSGKYDSNKSPRIGYFWLFKPIITAERGIGPTTLKNPDHYSSLPNTNQNPVAMMQEDVDGYQSWNNTQYQTTLELTYTVPWVKGLKAKVLGAYDGNINDNSILQKGYYLYDYQTDAKVVDPAVSTYSNSKTTFARRDVQAQLLYNNSFGQHTIGATMVWEAKKMEQKTISGKRQYDDIYTNDVLDQGSLTNLSNGGNRTEEAFLSLLGRANYDYMNKYLFEFAFRYDGSYKYAPGKRWAFFPSLSAGWRISEESFIKENLPFISNLKLRGSYGWMGADAGNPFQYYSGYTLAGISGGYVFNDGILTNGVLFPGVINNNLTWIKTKTANIGLDIDLWNGKLSASVDFFQKNRNGLLATKIQSVPNTFGASFPQENLNSDLVRGFELVISHRNSIRDFKYGVSANLVYSRKKLLHTERSPYSSSWEAWKDSQGSNRYTGREWGFIYDGQYTNIQQYQEAPLIGGSVGNSKGLPGSYRVIDVNGDGIINDKDQLPTFWAGQQSGIANNPPLQYGFNLDVAWKGFDLNVLLQGSALFTVFTQKNDIWGYGSYPVLWEQYMDRWHTANINDDPYDPNTQWISGKYPALKTDASGTTDAMITDLWRLNASYLRIKSIEIGYTFPKQWTKAIGLEGLRIYANGFNLFTFCGKGIKDLDPEREEGDYTADLTYPLMRSFNFGLSINF